MSPETRSASLRRLQVKREPIEWEVEYSNELSEDSEEGPAEMQSFVVRCKTTEFLTKLNLPTYTLDLLGTEQREIYILTEEFGEALLCWYEYRQIDKLSRGFARLVGGWTKVVKKLEISQGDTLLFQMHTAGHDFFRIFIERHDVTLKMEGDPVF